MMKKCFKLWLKLNQKLIKLTFSSVLTSAIFGRVGGGLFFMSSKTSTAYMKYGQLMEDSVRLS